MGIDATQELTMYQLTTTEVVTDLQAIQCAVGRVQTRGEWGIIDRSASLARTEFIQSDSSLQPSVPSDDGQDIYDSDSNWGFCTTCSDAYFVGKYSKNISIF